MAKEAQLRAEVAELLARAAAIDAHEDAAYGPDCRGDELPKGLASQQKRLRKIQEAKAALEARCRQATDGSETTGKPTDPPAAGASPPPPAPATEAKHSELPEPAAGSTRKAASGVPPKAQINFRDPDSRIMRGPRKSWVQAYNVQIAVDSAYQIIAHGRDGLASGCPALDPDDPRGPGPDGGRSVPLPGGCRLFQRGERRVLVGPGHQTLHCR